METLDGRKVVDFPRNEYFTDFLRAKMTGRHDLVAILGNSMWLFMDKVLRIGVGYDEHFLNQSQDDESNWARQDLSGMPEFFGSQTNANIVRGKQLLVILPC